MNERLLSYLERKTRVGENTKLAIYGTSKEFCLRHVLKELVGLATVLNDGRIAFQLPKSRRIVSQEELLEAAERASASRTTSPFQYNFPLSYDDLKVMKPLEAFRKAALSKGKVRWELNLDVQDKWFWDDAQEILRRANLSLPKQFICGAGFLWQYMEGAWTPETTSTEKVCEFFPEHGVMLFTEYVEFFGLQLCFCYGSYYRLEKKEHYNTLVDAQMKKCGEASIRELLSIIVAPLKNYELSEMVETGHIDKLKPFIPTYLLGFNLYRKVVAEQAVRFRGTEDLYFDIKSLSPKQLATLKAFEFPDTPKEKPRRKVKKAVSSTS